MSGDDRFERAKEQLEKQNSNFSVKDAFKILESVRQEGIWATRVSFVYSVKAHKVFYVLDNRLYLFRIAKWHKCPRGYRGILGDNFRRIFIS